METMQELFYRDPYTREFSATVMDFFEINVEKISNFR